MDKKCGCHGNMTTEVTELAEEPIMVTLDKARYNADQVLAALTFLYAHVNDVSCAPNTTKIVDYKLPVLADALEEATSKSRYILEDIMCRLGIRVTTD